MSETLLKDALIGVVDVETTGLDPEKDCIVELAMVPHKCGYNVGTGGKWSMLYNPGIPIPASASCIHHIVDEDVKSSTPFIIDGGELSFYKFLAAHNAEFDSGFLKAKQPIVCTMRLAQKLWPDLESYGNQFLRYKLNLKPPVERGAAMHRALPDALVTATLLEKELQTVISSLDVDIRDNVPNNTVEELISWIEKPMLLHRVRFGKHGPQNGKEGLLWSSVPKDYLRWLLTQDFDRDVVYTAKYYLNSR